MSTCIRGDGEWRTRNWKSQLNSITYNRPMQKLCTLPFPVTVNFIGKAWDTLLVEYKNTKISLKCILV